VDEKPDGFVSLKSLKRQAPRSPAEIVAEIRRIYFKTTRQTIENDFAHAIELLKSLPDEESREKAHVYMEGLAEMQKEWLRAAKPRKPSNQKSKIKNHKSKITNRE
jgi:hypothetical protein